MRLFSTLYHNYLNYLLMYRKSTTGDSIWVSPDDPTPKSIIKVISYRKVCINKIVDYSSILYYQNMGDSKTKIHDLFNVSM